MADEYEDRKGSSGGDRRSRPGRGYSGNNSHGSGRRHDDRGSGGYRKGSYDRSDRRSERRSDDRGKRDRRDGYRPRGRDGTERTDEDRRREYRRRSDDRPPRREHGNGSGERRERNSDRRSDDRGGNGYRRGRDRDHRDGRSGGYRNDRGSGGRNDSKNHSGGRNYGRSDRRSDDRTPRDDERADRVTIPSDPQKILFKGIDCEVNGRSDLALILYLHGASKMSGGCEENAEKLLRPMTPEMRDRAREAASKQCGEDQLIEFDYVRLQLDPSADSSFIDEASARGNPLATYCLIRLDRVDPDDPAIDVFALSADERPEMVKKGLDRLRRRHDSKRAADRLREVEAREKARSSINQTFAKAMRNDAKALARLEDMSGEFPEAGFLAGYIESEDPEAYLREGMREHRDLIIAVSANLNLDSGFARYLRALKAKADGEDWIPLMVSAVDAGSEDAERELGSVRGRGDVSRALAEAAIRKGDLQTLVRMYDGEDARWLDAWCAGDPSRMIEAGRLMKEEEELDWLKRCFRNGSEECRDAIVAMASDESRWSKRLVYALHDVGADMEAARLYFAIGDERRLPSPKWLAKVCADEDVRGYVRSEYESRGDPAAFEDIFADDGYEKKRSGRGRGGKGSGKGRKR